MCLRGLHLALFAPLFVVLALAPDLPANATDAVGSDAQRERQCAELDPPPAPPPPSHAERYFHAVPRHANGQIKRWLDCLPRCRRIDERCVPGDAILNAVYGIRRHELPNVIVHLAEDVESSELRARRPTLMWKRHNTPYVRGADHLWVLVVADRRPAEDLQVHLLTLFEKTANPFAGLLALLEVVPATHGPKPARSETSRISEWREVDMEAGDPLYIGTTRLSLAAESVNLLSVLPVAPTVPDAPSPQVLLPMPLPNASDLKLVLRGPPLADPEAGAAEDTARDGAPTIDLSLGSVHFSNSSPSRVAFSVGLLGTFRAGDTSFGEEEHFNGYALAKGYVVKPRIKAYLDTGEVGRRGWPSVGLVLGTNLDDPFQEIVLGVAVGHLFGRTGLVAGVNWIPGGEHVDRKWRPFAGFEYTF